jgi:hypothetical protein
MFECSTYRNHIQIDLRRHTSVEPKFLVAIEAAFFQGRKVQESKIDWLLDLVSVLSRQKHPGNVSFEKLDRLHRMALRDKAPLLLRAHEGEADAWMPLMQLAGGQYGALANWYNFTWRPIFGGSYDEITRMSLLRQLAATASDRTRRLTLAPVPNEDGSASQIAAAFKASGWVVEMTECDENHYLKLNGRSFDQYWEIRPGQLKSTVKRKGKKGVVSVRIEREFSNSSWADYERVYARSWKPHEGNPDFLKQLAQQESAAGALRIGLAYIDGQPVAAQFWTVENGVALIHKLAHDERHLEFSPGTLLSAALWSRSRSQRR